MSGTIRLVSKRYSGCSRDTTGDQLPTVERRGVLGRLSCLLARRSPCWPQEERHLPALPPLWVVVPTAGPRAPHFSCISPPLILPLVFIKLVRLGRFSGKGIEGNQCRGEEHKLWSQSD